MITATPMLTSTLAVSTTLTFMMLTTTMSSTNITTPLKIMMKGGTVTTMKRKHIQQHTCQLTQIRVMNLMRIITQMKAYCVKKTQKTPSSVMTSINDMKTRQLKYT